MGNNKGPIIQPHCRKLLSIGLDIVFPLLLSNVVHWNMQLFILFNTVANNVDPSDDASEAKVLRQPGLL